MQINRKIIWYRLEPFVPFKDSYTETLLKYVTLLDNKFIEHTTFKIFRSINSQQENVMNIQFTNSPRTSESITQDRQFVTVKN